MKNNNKNCQNKRRFNVAIVAIVVLAGCGFINFAFGLANPSAVYCDELGYQYIIKETENGQRGFCQFPNGSIVDGWQFFIGEKGQDYSYCKKQGYEIKTITSEQCQYASKCAVCILEDGTETDVAKLMKLNLNSTLLPWDPIEPTTAPEHKTNYLFYFLCVVILIIFLTIAFVTYKKMKNRNDYYR
jgi:putative hemolysin